MIRDSKTAIRYYQAQQADIHIFIKDKIGPVEAVFLADPEEMRAVFAQEGKYPRHVLPEAWTVYNRKYGRSRGLFFMEGEEWWRYRRLMNGLLLKGDVGAIEEACEVSEWAERREEFAKS